MRCVVSAISGILPTGIGVEVRPIGKFWQLRAFASDVKEGDLLPGAGVSVAMLPAGYGTWIPFVPRRLDAELTAKDAVEAITDVVSDVAGKPWPGTDYRVRADVGIKRVLVRFERPDGTGRMDLAPIPRELF